MMRIDGKSDKKSYQFIGSYDFEIDLHFHKFAILNRNKLLKKLIFLSRYQSWCNSREETVTQYSHRKIRIRKW